ncbi:MAG: transglycosylase domain-containing protein [Dehalococcoidia bacterium]
MKRIILRHRRLTAILGILTTVVGSLCAYSCFAPFDSPESKLTVPGTVVLDSQGVVLQRDGSEGFRIPVSLAEVAPVMRDATIAAEDQRFEHHFGVDPIAMARVALSLGKEHSGASTITQQLARRLYLKGGGGPLPVRKARESLIAMQLEAHRSKDEILELYLNEVYYGRGAYGVEAAARVYFGVSAANLDLARASFLAGLPQLPSAYQEATTPEAMARRDYVLARMVEDGKVSAAAAAAAHSEPLNPLPAIEPPIAAQFVTYALDELARIRPDLAGRKGLVIETTLDAGLQVESERLARQQLESLSDRNVTNAAIVVLDPASGAILTMVGSTSGDINLALAPRQPGSALKPFLYGAAFELGYTAATPLLDVPTTFVDGPETFEPLDFDRRYRGLVPLRTALGSSLNIPAVATLEAVGIDRFLRTANSFGLSTLTDAERYGLSLTLGGGEVRLIDLTGAYGALASGGELSRPFAVTRVRDTAGNVLYQRPAVTPQRVISAQDAYLLSDILSDHDARVPGFGQVTPFDLPFQAAAKTGTTTGFRDNWTMGYTANFAVGVWVGNADSSAMQNVSGVDGAGPIWRDVMLATAMTRDPAWVQRPEGLVEATVCSPTGLLPGTDCPNPVRELFVAGTVPSESENYYVREADGEVAVAPPPAALAWAHDAGLRLVSDYGQSTPGALRIVSPGNGSTLFLAPELASQEVLLRASAGPGARAITFLVNGETAGTVAGGDVSLVYPLHAGHYEVKATARYEDGTTDIATSTFEVKPK